MEETSNEKRAICESSNVVSGETGFTFNVLSGGMEHPAFIIRNNQTAYAYLNKCAHLMLELDWDNGEFFDPDGEYIVCANHGALFEPDTGLCINGPCYGQSLMNISIKENDDKIVMNDHRFSLAD